MIRPLRQYHRRAFIALGLFLPVVFALGIAVRKPVPTMAPAAVLKAPAEFTVTLPDQPGLFSKAPVQVHLLQASTDPHRLAVSFKAAPDFVEPDLLVYGIPGSLTATDSLAGNAILLGRFATPVLPLPDSLTQTNGMLLLYSLANQEMVDVSKPIQFKDFVK